MMKTTYKFIFLISSVIVSLSAVAQTNRSDSAMNRQVLLEREYNPTLQGASKVNTTPSIYTPVIKGKEFNFISTTPQVKVDNSQIGSAQSGDIRTNIDYSKKRGYLNFAAGTHGNLDGAAGVRIVNATNDRLDLFGTYGATSGTVDFIDGNKYIYKDAKAKYSALDINLKYQHTFEPSVLTLGGSFYNTSYNYYGNTFLTPEISAFPYDITSKQNVDVFSFNAGLKSSDNNQGELKYNATVNYQNFKSKYGIAPEEKGPKGGQFDLGLEFGAAFDSDKLIGIKASLMNQTYSNKDDFYLGDTAYHSFSNVTATPYFKMEGDSWNIDLGLNASALFDVKNKLHVSPNIKAEARIYDVNVLYGEVTGGVNNNTFLDILQENRYVNYMGRVHYSKTLFDAKVGFKSGVISGFEFDLFAGYKKTDDDHLYIATTSYNALAPTDPSWGNVGTPIYADISTGHIGGALKTTLIPATDLSAKITGFFYDVKNSDFDKAFGRPAFTAQLNADVRPIDKLTLSLNYLYAGGRKALSHSLVVGEQSIVSMKDINELNLRAEYQIMDWISVNVRLNNVFSQKYELQYGYPLQTFNALGGVAFKF
ncbi:MAG: hypothetical protein LBV43_10005 [Prevotella sp.]|jgi:outer membrane cobalamin receptor|nr:hypothetical protein [Prevotella sp.]